MEEQAKPRDNPWTYLDIKHWVDINLAMKVLFFEIQEGLDGSSYQFTECNFYGFLVLGMCLKDDADHGLEVKWDDVDLCGFYLKNDDLARSGHDMNGLSLFEHPQNHRNVP